VAASREASGASPSLAGIGSLPRRCLPGDRHRPNRAQRCGSHSTADVPRSGRSHTSHCRYHSAALDQVRLRLGRCAVTRVVIDDSVPGRIRVHENALERPTFGPGPVVFSTVMGRLELCTAHAPRRCTVGSTIVCGARCGCVRPYAVRFVGSAGIVRTVPLHRGRFRLVVAPGHYTVELLGDGPRVRERVLRRRTVSVGRYGVAHLTFRITVPGTRDMLRAYCGSSSRPSSVVDSIGAANWASIHGSDRAPLGRADRSSLVKWSRGLGA
jgi:hypothetical protein